MVDHEDVQALEYGKCIYFHIIRAFCGNVGSRFTENVTNKDARWASKELTSLKNNTYECLVAHS